MHERPRFTRKKRLDPAQTSPGSGEVAQGGEQAWTPDASEESELDNEDSNARRDSSMTGGLSRPDGGSPNTPR